MNPTAAAFPGQPLFPDYSPLVVSTPEGNYQQALTTGVSDPDKAITQQLNENNNVLVFGYSESSAIATQEMVNLDALPADQQPNPEDLQFLLVEDLNNPNGGFLERFPFLATESFRRRRQTVPTRPTSTISSTVGAPTSRNTHSTSLGLAFPVMPGRAGDDPRGAWIR